MVVIKMVDINKIYKMLNWENPPEVQLEGIRLAQEIKDLSLLIKPHADPSVWECCSNILYEKSDEELEPYLDGLLEWLQDLNWPGALTITERLKTLKSNKLKDSLEQAIVKSNKMPKDECLMWIDYLSELLDNKVIVANLSGDSLTLLKKHYHNWGSWRSE